MKSKNIHIFILFLTLIFGSTLKGQSPLNYYTSQGVKVSQGGNALKNPWTGGYNNGQMASLDVNNDGLDDLILFDTDFNDIQVYRKESNGTFSFDAYLSRKLPLMRNLMRVADLNSDGKPDLFTESETYTLKIYLNVTEPADSIIQFAPQGVYSGVTDEYTIYYRTRLVDTSEPWVGMSPLGIESSDIPHIGDIDGDGDIDILKFDGTYNSYTLFKDMRVEKGLSKDTFEFQDMEYCYGYFYENFNGDIVFDSCGYTERLTQRHSSGASSLMFDSDGDNDQDLLISSGVFNYLTKLTNAKKNFNTAFDTMVAFDTLFPKESKRSNQMFFPSLNGIDFNSDDIIDIGLASTFFEAKQSQNNLYFYEGYKIGDSIKHKLVTSPLANQFLDVGAYSSPAIMDIDRDGDLDLLIASESNGGLLGSETTFKINLFENKGTKTAPDFVSIDDNYLNISQYPIKYPHITCGDLNGDGQVDIVLGDNSGSIYFFKNTNTTGMSSFTMESNSYITRGSFWNAVAAPSVFDYNGDALPDLLLGYQSGYVDIFENTGSVSSPAFTLAQDSAWYAFSNKFQTNVSPPKYQHAGFCSPWLGDMDNDGKKELLCAGQLGQVYRYNIDGKPTDVAVPRDPNTFWTKNGNDSFMAEFGGYASIAVADLDGDSISEILVGTKNGGLKLLSAVANNNSIGTKRIEALAFNLVPNPANQKVLIGLKESAATDWRIYSSNGTLVLKGNNSGKRRFYINTTNLPSGLYFLQLLSNGQMGVQKLQITDE